MYLQYGYGGEEQAITVNWTEPDGRSVVFEEIVEQLEERYGPSFSPYREAARALDEKVDKLYEEIYIFNDEHQAIPYNPKTRNRFLRVYADLCDELEQRIHPRYSGDEQLLYELFAKIMDKLQEIVGVYLLETAYQGKHRYRRKNFEEWAETIKEEKMAHDSESVLLQMTDLAKMLDRLTDTQRRRLVGHLFMGYTLQEIAKQECVSKQSVEESVASALKRLRTLMQK